MPASRRPPTDCEREVKKRYINNNSNLNRFGVVPSRPVGVCVSRSPGVVCFGENNNIRYLNGVRECVLTALLTFVPTACAPFVRRSGKGPMARPRESAGVPWRLQTRHPAPSVAQPPTLDCNRLNNNRERVAKLLLLALEALPPASAQVDGADGGREGLALLAHEALVGHAR